MARLLGEAHYSLVHASFLKRYQLQYILLGDLREVPYQMGMGTYPMGWDAFGLPTEQYALKTGEDPEVVTKNNIANFKRQLNKLGFSYDWDREVTTSDPNYYKWTQCCS